MRVLIVGDGVAGHTAAETARDLSSDAEIHVFTREGVPFYDRIGLRDYIREGREEEDLILGGEDWYEENKIGLHLDTEITGIDRGEKEVSTSDGGSFSYDRLLLAVGGTPRKIPMEEGMERVHHLWTLEEHGRSLRKHLEEANDGVVIGGGLLGFDLIGSFYQAVSEPTYLIREENWWPSVLDPGGASIIHGAMEEVGIDLKLGEEAASFTEEGGKVNIETDRGEYTTDVVGMAIGHERNLELAEGAGLETNRGIISDEFLKTSDEDVYVAGDVAEYRDVVLEKTHMGGSWVTAEEQGKVAGANLVGEKERLEFVDTYTVSHFGTNVASLGNPRDTEGKEVLTALDRDGKKYRKLVIENDRIVGGAILGEMKWLYPLKQLILQKTDISGEREILGDTSNDLKELL